MTINIAPAAAAIAFAAIAAAPGHASAQDIHADAMANHILINNIHKMIDQSQDKTFELVLAKAEQSIELKLAKIENLIAPKPTANDMLVIANNGL